MFFSVWRSCVVESFFPVEDWTSSKYFLFHSVLETMGVEREERGHLPQIYSIFCHFVRWQQCPEPSAAARFKSKYLPPNNLLGEDFAIPCTTCIQSACISLAPSHVPEHWTFHTALSCLMLNLPLTKSSQQSKTARHCRAVLPFLYCVAKNIILLLWYW